MKEEDELGGTCVLMEQAASGHRPALEVLLMRYRPLLDSEARRSPPGLREDVLQEIRCLLLEALPKFRSPLATPHPPAPGAVPGHRERRGHRRPM